MVPQIHNSLRLPHTRTHKRTQGTGDKSQMVFSITLAGIKTYNYIHMIHLL